MLTGGCFCGSVRYAVDGPVSHETICHCSDCRRAIGATQVPWFTAPIAAFRYTAGTPTAFASSPPVRREFCPSCGTGLTYRHADVAGEVDITIASLDDPNAVPPRDRTEVAEKPAWEVLCDRLPRHWRRRTEHPDAAPRPAQLSDAQWNAVLTLAATLFKVAPRTSPRPAESGSWCSFTTFDRMQSDWGYWQMPLPTLPEIYDSYAGHGPHWSQYFYYRQIAHFIVPRQMTQEMYRPTRAISLVQDVDTLSHALSQQAIPHRITPHGLEICCY